MKSDLVYDLLIIGGGISACVFASNYLQNNITQKIAIIEVGRGLGGRSSTRTSKRFKGWKINHGSPNFNVSNSKNNFQLKSYINELLKNKFIKIDDSELVFIDDESYLKLKINLNFLAGLIIFIPYGQLSKKIIECNDQWKIDLFLNFDC